MRTKSVFIRLIVCCSLLSLAPLALATENGGSVYPAGVETVAPGTMAPPGSTLLLEFNDFYMANGLANSKGESEVPGFHLRVGAWAVKIEHNWGIHVLGGTLVSTAAIPLLYETLTVPGAAGSKTGLSNGDIQFAAVSYAKRAWHWWYSVDFVTPGPDYTKSALLNVGQHNLAYSPSAAFTYLPHHGRLELSSKYTYIINGVDPATNYRSGDESLWEYDGMVKIGKRLSIGGNGYWYQQLTNDLQNGLIVGDGNRGRNLAIGPQLNYHVGPCLLIAKYQKDTLVENRPIGNSFWLEFGIPLGHPHE